MTGPTIKMMAVYAPLTDSEGAREALARRVERFGVADVAALDAMVARMDARIDALAAAGDRREVFLYAYRVMTHQMRKNLLGQRFMDPRWTVSVTVRFAQMYFDADEAFERDDGSCPLPWEAFFRAAIDRRATILETLLLGMNAHIVYDLPVSLAYILRVRGEIIAVGSGPEPSAALLHIRRFDHDQVNEILEETIDLIQDAVADRFSIWLKVWDALGGRLDEWLTSRLLRIFRAQVWYHGAAMASARDDAEYEAVRRHLLYECGRNVARIDLVERLPFAWMRALARLVRAPLG
jgi:hypothetical protein